MLPPSRGALAEGTGAGSLSLAAATRLLEQARAEAARGCAHPSDVLVAVLCEKRLRVGLRAYYPGFSVRGDDGAFAGFEPDIARRIAAFLGVRLVTVAVDPKSRIPMLAGGQVDLVIATMGHTIERGAEVTVIRPHYYVSQTAIVGAVKSAVADWDDLGGRTVCLPLGASSNIIFARHNIRILTFDRPEQLLDALRFNKCAFIVHDDTFFAQSLTDPAWSAQFGIKFRFAPLPWGMAVARENTEQFAALLEALSVGFHADGVFLQLAAANRIDPSFLETEHKRWADSSCVAANGAPLGNCLMPPVNNARASRYLVCRAAGNLAGARCGGLVRRQGRSVGFQEPRHLGSGTGGNRLFAGADRRHADQHHDLCSRVWSGDGLRPGACSPLRPRIHRDCPGDAAAALNVLRLRGGRRHRALHRDDRPRRRGIGHRPLQRQQCGTRH